MGPWSSNEDVSGNLIKQTSLKSVLVAVYVYLEPEIDLCFGAKTLNGQMGSRYIFTCCAYLYQLIVTP